MRILQVFYRFFQRVDILSITTTFENYFSEQNVALLLLNSSQTFVLQYFAILRMSCMHYSAVQADIRRICNEIRFIPQSNRRCGTTTSILSGFFNYRSSRWVSIFNRQGDHAIVSSSEDVKPTFPSLNRDKRASDIITSDALIDIIDDHRKCRPARIRIAITFTYMSSITNGPI